MGLLDLLPSSNLGLQGQTPGQVPSANPNSTLHNEYSINGVPVPQQTVPAPSQLDLDGTTPPKYLDNPPG
jgi:hypothetical protein